MTSLILATLVIPFLWESYVSAFAQNNNNTYAIPFLPPSSTNNTISPEKSTTLTNNTSLQNNAEQKSDQGALTIKQVIVGTDQLLPNSKFKITPNPFTLKGSLIIYDNNATLDSDPDNGVVVLRSIKFSPYIINETSSPGFGPVLLKTRITVHNTNPDPIVTIENRQLDLPFTGSATVTSPYLNDSSFRTFVSNGAKVAGGTITLSRVDQLPSGILVSSEKQKLVSNINESSLVLKPVIFNTSVSATASASQLYELFKIPTYPAPVKDIAPNVAYVSPAFIVKQQRIGNATITLTPIIAKTFPNMTLLLNNNSFVGSGLAKVQNLKMKFAQEANNVGFSFGISNNIPSSFVIPKIPVDAIALFMNIGYVGGKTTAAKIVNFSNSKSFASSPDINIVVSKSLDTAKLADGCPDINLYSFKESATKWTQLDKPLRIPSLDINDKCGYSLHTQHFSKFAVGGVKQQTSS
jgi:hypothetical protein